MGNYAKVYFAHLQKLQKKIVRVIIVSKFNSHTQPLMYELELLNIEKNYIFTVGIVMFMVNFLVPLIACFHTDIEYMTKILGEQINFKWNNFPQT